MTYGWNNYGNESSNSNQGSSRFKRTNFVLKEEVARNWNYYQLQGNCEVKPYPVFSQQGPCPSRLVTSFEAGGPVDITMLTDEDKRRYATEAVPPAYIYLGQGIVNYAGTGDDHYTFINHVTDMEAYDTNYTPYSLMYMNLIKVTPKKDEPVGPQHSRAVSSAKAKGLFTAPRSALVFRGALLKHKGAAMATKYSVNGMLPKTVFVIMQKNVISKFLQSFLKQQDLMKPLSADNSIMSHMLQPNGTTMVLTKMGTDNSAEYDLMPNYNQQTNTAIMGAWEASNDAAYMDKVYKSFGGAQALEDMFDSMTAEQMVEMLAQAYPVSWLWYGLRDTPYAPLVRQYAVEAERDVELTKIFNPGAAPAVNYAAPVQPAPSPAPQPVYSAPAWQQPTMSDVMPTINNLPPQPAFDPDNGEDEVPMGDIKTQDQQQADDVVARLRAKINGGN